MDLEQKTEEMRAGAPRLLLLGSRSCFKPAVPQHEPKCPLLAKSRHSSAYPLMSAIGGKADIPRSGSSGSNGAKLHKSSGLYKSVEGVL